MCTALGIQTSLENSARHGKPWASSCWFLVEAWEGKVNWQRYGPSRSSCVTSLHLLVCSFKTYFGPSPARNSTRSMPTHASCNHVWGPRTWTPPMLLSYPCRDPALHSHHLNHRFSILVCLDHVVQGKKNRRSKQATAWTSGVQHGPATPTQHNTLTACQHRETATPSEVWLLYPGQCWLWVLICLVYEKNLQRFNTASLWRWRVFIARNPSWFPINTNIYDHHCFYNTYLWQLDVTAAKHQQIQRNLRW